MSKDRKALIIVLSTIIVLLSSALIYLNTDLFKETEVRNAIDNNVSQNIRFYREYPNVDQNNVYYYATYDEIVQLFTSGTGIVFFGFSACPWCQVYAPVLDEVARERGVEKIYYLDIREMRENNTDEYKKLVDFTQEYLENDENGNKKIFVPDSYFIKEGKIVGHNNSMSTLSGSDVEEYFNEEKRKELKKEFITLVEKVYEPVCDDLTVKVYGGC